MGEDALFHLVRVVAREVGDVKVSRLWIEQAAQDEVEPFATLSAARPAVAFVGAAFLRILSAIGLARGFTHRFPPHGFESLTWLLECDTRPRGQRQF